jgi:hypothetical protein
MLLHDWRFTSSLTRRLVCRLQLLLALASAVILESESRGIRFETPNLEGQVPVFIYPRNRGRLDPQALCDEGLLNEREDGKPKLSHENKKLHSPK